MWLDRLLGVVAHHVPAAEGEQRRRYGEGKIGQTAAAQDREALSSNSAHAGIDRRAGVDRVLRCWLPQRQPDDDDQDDRSHFDQGKRGLEIATVPHAAVVDSRQHQDGRYRHHPRRGVVERHDEARVGSEHHGQGSNDPGVHDPEHRPAPEKAEPVTKLPAQVDVDSPARRHRRCQLGDDQSAEHGEHAGGQPDQRRAGHRRHLPDDLGWLYEDRGTDDRADNHGNGVSQPDGAMEPCPWRAHPNSRSVSISRSRRKSQCGRC